MKLSRRALLATASLAALLPRAVQAAAAATVPPGIFTRQFDSGRTGHWPHETLLTQAAVRTRGMVLRQVVPLYGDAHGCEGQPLIVPSVTIADGSVHHVVITATDADWVQGHDTDTGAELWRVSVGTAILSTVAEDMWLTNQHFGVLSSAVINPATGTYYCVAMSAPDASFADAQFFLCALSPKDGTAVAAPLNISTATYQPPGGLPAQKFSTAVRKQRAGLALSADNSTVYICTGSFLESASTNRGFVIAADVSTSTLKLAATYTTCVTGSGAGIWMGSDAPAFTRDGDLLVVTANGDFDGLTNFGESLLRLSYDKASTTTPAAITRTDYWTPYTDPGRLYGAAYQTLPSLGSIPNAIAVRDAADPLPVNAMGMRSMAAVPHGAVVHNSAPAPSNQDSAADEDVGSAGVVYWDANLSGLPYNLAIFGGKDGIIYICDADGMNGPTLADFAPTTILAKVYGALLTPPFWASYYNPATPEPTDLEQLSTTYAGRTHHIHNQCCVYKSPVLGPCLYIMGENGNLRVVGLSTEDTIGIRATYLGCSVEYASPDAPVVPGQRYGGMPGGMLSISSNNGAVGSGLVHAFYPTMDSNREASPGVYAVFDADNLLQFPNNGGGHVQCLWKSSDWNINFLHSKFNRGSPWNGDMFQCTGGGTMNIWSLTPE